MRFQPYGPRKSNTGPRPELTSRFWTAAIGCVPRARTNHPAGTGNQHRPPRAATARHRLVSLFCRCARPVGPDKSIPRLASVTGVDSPCRPASKPSRPETGLTCPNCGAAILKSDVFCPACGLNTQLG
uniref:zinc ribbon domain-containing protein n=1 Tax=Chloracidobacterium validum TaxID=2821543 RepID=UPI00387E93FB